MREITPNEVELIVNEGTLVNIIDVRETDEAAQGKIPGAVNIPLGLVEFRMNELDKSKEYIMVCRSGGRSGSACQFLENQGFNAINMTGGMLAWEGETK
jgi:rhodanese-related sulfurtransferase